MTAKQAAARRRRAAWKEVERCLIGLGHSEDRDPRRPANNHKNWFRRFRRATLAWARASEAAWAAR